MSREISMQAIADAGDDVDDDDDDDDNDDDGDDDDDDETQITVERFIPGHTHQEIDHVFGQMWEH